MINFLNSVAFCTHKSTPFSIIGYNADDSNESNFYSVARQVVELNAQRGCRYVLNNNNLTFEFKYKHLSELGVESSLSVEFRFAITNKERLEHLYMCLPTFCKLMREKTQNDWAIKLSKTHFPVVADVETTIYNPESKLFFGPLPQSALYFENTAHSGYCFVFDVATIKFEDEPNLFTDIKPI